MALMRSLRRLTRYAPKAKQLAEQNAGKIAENVSKATDYVDDKTKGRYTDKLRKVDEKANDFAEQRGQTPTGSAGSDGPSSGGPSSGDTDATAPDAGPEVGTDPDTQDRGPGDAGDTGEDPKPS